MNPTLTMLSRWLIPEWFRRIPRPVKWTLGLICGALLIPFPAPTYANLESYLIHQNFGWTLYGLWQMLGEFLSPLVCSISLFAGTMSIVRERRKAIWHSLAFTPISPNSILQVRALATWVQVAFLVLPALVALCQGAEIRYGGDIQIQGILMLAIETALRITAFVLIGMVISVRCTHVGTALSIAGAMIAGLIAACMLSPYAAYAFFVHSDPNLHAHLFFWPTTMVVNSWYVGSGEWKPKLMADLIWGIVLPCICWAIIRRSYRATIQG